MQASSNTIVASSRSHLARSRCCQAETQVCKFEQAVYDALNVVNLAEKHLKNLVSPNRAAHLERIVDARLIVAITVPTTPSPSDPDRLDNLLN